MKKLTVGSCFSGIGGLELGLECTGGFETKWQIEIDPYATKVLKKHWPNVKRYGDIVCLNKSMSFAEDSPAKTYPSPTPMAPDCPASVQDSGGNYYERFAWYDRGFQSWRTFQTSLTGGWTEFSETWPAKGLIRNGVAYRLTGSGRITGECGCLLLPTPQASDGMRLRFTVEQLDRARIQHRKRRTVLGSYLAEHGLSQTPELSEYLMGFPIGFTEIANGNNDSNASETPLIQESRKKSEK